MNSDYDERRLDEVLQKYGAAEPRTGLESRILANLTAERERLGARSWRWRLAAATLGFGIVAVIAFLLARKPDAAHIDVARQAPITTLSPETTRTVVPKQQTIASQKPRIPRTSERRVMSDGKPPHLDQFPSPSPLNEQEEMLARYVRDRRQEAVMVARARAELLKRDLAGFLEESPSSGQTRDLQQ